MSIVGNHGASLQAFCNETAHPFLHVTFLQGRPWSRDTRENAAVIEETARVEKDGDEKGQEVGSGDDEDVVDFANAESLSGLIDGCDE